MNDGKKMVAVKKNNGEIMNVEVITYLFSDDNVNTYMVYSKGEITGADQDEVIYISRVTKDGNVFRLHGISDDVEWGNVQKLLKKIANG